MKYGMQVEIEEKTADGGRRKVWKWVRPTSGQPYEFDTEQEARRMAEMSYATGYGTLARVRKFDP